MSNLDSAWGNVNADSGITEDNVPPAGYVGCPRVSDIRVGRSKKNEDYFLVELTDDQGGYKWPLYKQLTKGGQPHDGSIKSAKITLRQLGLDVPHPSALESMLRSIVGRYYTVEQRASDRINPNTGMPYVNTEVTGVASAPTLNVAQPQQPAPAVQPPAPAAPQFQPAQNGAELQNQFAQAQQHNAQVMGQPAPAPQAPGAQFGDAAPWDQV